VTPFDPDWDAARTAWNLAVDQHPAAVALPESAQDIVTIVDLARENGLRAAPQGTGHNAHPLEGRLAETILVKTGDRPGHRRPDRRHDRARVLLPATMKLLGKWNWYLPNWLGWLPKLEHHVEPVGRPAPAAA
jgi:FAD binding domain